MYGLTWTESRTNTIFQDIFWYVTSHQNLLLLIFFLKRYLCCAPTNELWNLHIDGIPFNFSYYYYY